MRLEHFKTLHLHKYNRQYVRGNLSAGAQAKYIDDGEIIEISSYVPRRWDIRQQAQDAINHSDYSGAAFLIGYMEGMPKAKEIVHKRSLNSNSSKKAWSL